MAHNFSVSWVEKVNRHYEILKIDHPNYNQPVDFFVDSGPYGVCLWLEKEGKDVVMVCIDITPEGKIAALVYPTDEDEPAATIIEKGRVP